MYLYNVGMESGFFSCFFPLFVITNISSLNAFVVVVCTWYRYLLVFILLQNVDKSLNFSSVVWFQW